ncbi:hypothetical protein [Pelagibacterium sp. H642]|uniref:sunset domain-containing protein n=1 Tax=Pelagibacterium sp. H642 TaxID=1881069 RepID=UPI002815F0A2|nr:hypothetical protein [Pelagibacterium sp. H642]WMT90177.1 hypothetical protein NO934_15470 [Pelagibacterium sp. H642]
MRAFKGLLSNVGIAAVAGAVGFAGVFGFSGDEPLAGQAIAMLSGECNIKGNVSIGSGERIYHVPGQRYYAATKIRPEYGERWFCSEAEARAAGWRRSGV